MGNSVKHLLIILISFFLLSSPVIGDNHKGETLYLWKTSSGEVWKGFGDKKINSVYKGDVKNGEPNGLGMMNTPRGDRYVGEWENGKRNGQGRDTWYSGDYYEGKWCDGEMCKGTFYNNDGTIMGYREGKYFVEPKQGSGELYMGYRNGVSGFYEEKWKGVKSEKNNDYGKYEGEIKNGQPSGKGTITYSNGSKYVIKERKNGKIWNGIRYDKDGNITGKMVNGK